MKFRLLVPIVAVLAAALIVAGCGSSDDTSSTESEASLSKAEFLKQGNAICAAGTVEINKGFESFAKEKNLSQGKEPSEAEFAEVGETILIPSISKQVEEIRALGTPEGDEGELDEFLTNTEEVLEEGEEDPEAFASATDSPLAGVEKEADEYGLTACGGEEEA